MSTDAATVELVGEETVENVARAAVLAALTGAFAYVSFPNPVSPVDVSLQVLGVFLAGILLGPVWGGMSMVFYLLAGAVGAPVFLGGSSGIGVLLGPSGGYLWSYPIAAATVGVLVHGSLGIGDPTEPGLARLVGAMAVGTAVVYAFGIAGLSLVLGLSLREAFLTGAIAFVPAEALKITAAVGVVRSDRLAAE